MKIVCVDILNGEETIGEDNDTKDRKRSALDMFLEDSAKRVKESLLRDVSRWALSVLGVVIVRVIFDVRDRVGCGGFNLLFDQCLRVVAVAVFICGKQERRKYDIFVVVVVVKRTVS